MESGCILCRKKLLFVKNNFVKPCDREANNCLLPSHPEHGTYTVSNYPSAKPGEEYSSIKLDISCDTGYLNSSIIGSFFCVNGDRSVGMPMREMLDDLKVEYHCLSFQGTSKRSQECVSLVRPGTVVRPICKFPPYFSFSILSEMHCRDGMWDYNPICKPACSLITQHLQLEGIFSNPLEVPWHFAIYRKGSVDIRYVDLSTATKTISSCSLITQHLQLEGIFSNPLEVPWHFAIYRKGSVDIRYVDLSTATKTISCCCYREPFPASDFVVAFNKMYRLYNDTSQE